jgi:excinuclease UvrABC ATPase subunit
MDVVRRADWIIDLGPEGGSKGGRIVFAGTPRALLDVPQSLTSQYLRSRSPTEARKTGRAPNARKANA